jgi:excisionase family DNA binding protein
VKFFTAKELSQYLNVKPKTIYSWVNKGEIPHYRIGKTIRFRKDEIEKWLEEKRKNELNPIFKGIKSFLDD